MGMQDNAFDIADACKKVCPDEAKEFIEYTWNLEEEVGELRRKIHRLNICLDILKERKILNEKDLAKD